MKKAYYTPLIFFAFISCTKFSFNEYKKNAGTLAFCNIATWTDVHGDEIRTNKFEYDSSGRPVSVTSNMNGTGNGHHFFTYDKQDRLSSYEYEFVEKKKFTYNNSSNVRPAGAEVTDVLGREFAESYTYDDRGRIIKSERSFVSSPYEEDGIPDVVREYIYLDDDLSSILLNGEQVNPDVVYSSKPSVYATNKVWMFINQNYSKHSVDAVQSVNRIGLPAKFKSDHYQFPFLDIETTGSSLTYACE